MRNRLMRLLGCALALAWCSAAVAATDIPAPPGGKRMGDPQRVEAGPVSVYVTAYRSPLTPGVIRDYYERKLPAQGWQHTAMPLPAQPAGSPVPSEWGEQPVLPEGILYFTKQGGMVAIRLQPEEDGSTLVLVNDLGEIARLSPTTVVAPPPPDEPPVPATSHDPIGLPVYHHAMRTLATGSAAERSLTRLYETADSPEAVLAFYREAMRESGWQLTNERSTTQPVAVPPAVRGRLAALAGRQAEEDEEPSALRTTELDFRRPQERCQLVVIHVPEALAGAEEQPTTFALQWMRSSLTKPAGAP